MNRVLVIEDNPKQNELICRIVERAGYEAIPAYNGVDGFAQLRKYRRWFGFVDNKITCILLDLNMDKMSGLEFINILRRKESWNPFKQPIPVVIVTAHDLTINREKTGHPCLGQASGFLVKPFDELQLKELLNDIIDLKEAEFLIRKNRYRQYKKDLSKEEILLQLKTAYFQGTRNMDSLSYLHQRINLAKQDYECAKKYAGDSAIIEKFQEINIFFKNEFNAIKEEIGVDR